MPPEATQVLATFAASFDLDAVPERVRQTAKGYLLDALACGAGAALAQADEVASTSAHQKL